MPARSHAAALEKYLNIVPVVEGVIDERTRDRVGLPQVIERLIGQHNAPAEGVGRPVALGHHDAVRRILLLHQQAEIKTRRTTANAQHIHRNIV